MENQLLIERQWSPLPQVTHDSIREKVMRLFSVTDGAMAEREAEEFINLLAHDFLRSHDVSTEIELRSLREQFADSRLPSEPSPVGEYFEDLSRGVVAHSIRTSSPRFIGHMTSALPHFVRPVSKLLTALNQNVVKVETAKSLSPYERQTLAMMHRLVYGCPDDFYADHAQHSESTLGMLVSGGTLANLTALWCARNNCFAPRGDFRGIEEDGLPAALACYGAHEAVIIGSRMLHYCFEKAAGLLGIGARSLRKVQIDTRTKRINLSALRREIEDCLSRGQRIVALVGVAGATETGTIDPLDQMADLAEEFGVHFHVDAAWGGAFLFSARHRHNLAGIERADSVTIDGHKQLYTPMGLGMLLLREPQLAKVIEKQANYVVRRGSFDLGRRTLEGSRPAMSLFLHAALNIIGRQGYEFLVNEGMRKTLYMADSIARRPEFAVLVHPEINILTYRYLPAEFRDRAELTTTDNAVIDRVNEALQRAQRRAGRNFVSRTKVEIECQGELLPVVALRVVLANPLTTEADIDAVLDDQVRIAQAQCLITAQA
jgi:putative pyridoxal-dependent aspartate 1-decarboxylase